MEETKGFLPYKQLTLQNMSEDYTTEKKEIKEYELTTDNIKQQPILITN